jgi:glycerophosphoryl diester phosphodiesterase
VPATSPAQRVIDRPLVFAHRGGRAIAPENTRIAFDAGLAAGADGLEFDVHLASDGHVVVIHDPTLERTTNGVGPVAAHPVTALAALRATGRFGIDLEREWAGDHEGLPTLTDVLVRYPDIPLIIEMKADRPELGAAVARAVRDAGAAARVCLGAFASGVMAAARRTAPEIATSAGREEARRALHRSWVGLGLGRAVPYRAFQVPERVGRLTVVSPRFIRAVHRAGCAIQVWTVNEESDMWRLLDWGVDGLITDRPGLAVAVRDAWVRQRAAR